MEEGKMGELNRSRPKGLVGFVREPSLPPSVPAASEAKKKRRRRRREGEEEAEGGG